MLKYLSLGFFVLAITAAAGYLYLNKETETELFPDGAMLQRTSHLDIEIIRQPFYTPVLPGKSRNILFKNGDFQDSLGRKMILRGINLGSLSKIPATPYLPTHLPDTSVIHPKYYSFVGHPLPLEQAEKHFERLRATGFHFIRLLISWEAVSPEGPGLYDKAYLAYLENLVETAASYNLSILLVLQQDSWSRYCGGSGAPYWTHTELGMDYRRIDSTASAFTHRQALLQKTQFSWQDNYQRYGAATMFTLFFAGDVFAPKLMVSGKDAKSFLQENYRAMAAKLAGRLGRFPNVVGMEAMHHPDPGFIGNQQLHRQNDPMSGPVYSAVEGMAMAAGLSLKKPFAKSNQGRISIKDSLRLNPNRLSIWGAAGELWRNHNVYQISTTGEIDIKQPNYFIQQQGKNFNFIENAYLPFIRKLAVAIDSASPGLPLWVQLPDGLPQGLPHNQLDRLIDSLPSPGANVILWNDTRTGSRRRLNPYLLKNEDGNGYVWGKKGIQKFWQQQLQTQQQEALLHGQPNFIGAIGIPFNLNKGRRFRESNIEGPLEAFRRLFTQIESRGLSYALWNYTPYHSDKFGDRWNGEDFSIYSPEASEDLPGIYRGVRLSEATVRPYPYKTNGKNIQYHYSVAEARFSMLYESGDSLNLPSVIYLPELHFGRGFTVSHTPAYLQYDALHQLLLFFPLNPRTQQKIEIKAADNINIF